MGREALGEIDTKRALGGAVGLGDGGGIALRLDQKGRAKQRANDAARQIRGRFRRGDEVGMDQGRGFRRFAEAAQGRGFRRFAKAAQGSAAGAVARLRR